MRDLYGSARRVTRYPYWMRNGYVEEIIKLAGHV